MENGECLAAVRPHFLHISINSLSPPSHAPHTDTLAFNISLPSIYWLQLALSSRQGWTWLSYVSFIRCYRWRHMGKMWISNNTVVIRQQLCIYLQKNSFHSKLANLIWVKIYIVETGSNSSQKLEYAQVLYVILLLGGEGHVLSSSLYRPLQSQSHFMFLRKETHQCLHFRKSFAMG